MKIERESWPDAMRAISCIMVIILHVSVWYVTSYGKIPHSHWLLGNIVDSFVRPCVPLFFMLSGYFFLNEKNVQVKNISRVAFSLVFYSAICLIYMHLTNRYNPSGRLEISFAKPVFYHLWFFYTLIGCYLLFMVFKVKVVSGLKCVVFIVMVFVVFNPFTENFTKYFGIKYHGAFLIDGEFIYSFFYCMLGAVLGKMNTTKIKRTLPLIGYVVFSLLTSFFIYNTSIMAGRYVGSFFSNVSPLVMFASVCLFVAIKNIYCHTPVTLPVKLISSLSLPVFGIHAVVIDFFVMKGVRDTTKPVFDMLFMFSLVLITSLALSWVIKKLDRKHLVS